MITASESRPTCDDVRFYVKTKADDKIPVRRGPTWQEVPLGYRKALADQDVLPLATRRRGPDPSYNCHGMTFVSKLGWIGSWPVPQPYELPMRPYLEAADPDEDIMRMLRGNGYVCRESMPNIDSFDVPATLDVGVGDVILYKSIASELAQINHSGIVVAVEEDYNTGRLSDIKVLSKFGCAGEYVHPYRHVPPGVGPTVEIWSDRTDAP